MKNRQVEFVVSGCLAGLNCRYDGGSNPCEQVVRLCRAGHARAICPESLSGLAVPRPPCEQKNGKVISLDGVDLTTQFKLGAERALQAALATGARIAIVKSKSPSCGHGRIYDGTFTHTLIPGMGLWTELLLANGFKIYTEKDLPELFPE